MHLIDDIDLVFPCGGRICHLIPDLTDIVHTVVGGSINLNHIHGSACSNGLTGGTFIAGIAVYWMLAVHRFGHDFGDGGLSSTSGSAE